MGVSFSLAESVSENDLLKAFCSSNETFAINSPFWDTLLNFEVKKFTLLPPSDSQLLESQSAKLCNNLSVNNSKTGNFGTLVNICLNRIPGLLPSLKNDSLNKLSYASADDSCLALRQATCCLCIIRHACRFFASNLSNEVMLDQFKESPLKSSASKDSLERIVNELVGALFSCVLVTPLEIDGSLDVLVLKSEAILLLLTLLSSDLYSSTTLRSPYFYRAVAGACRGEMASQVISCLLHYTTLDHQPYQKQATSSTITSRLFALLGLGFAFSTVYSDDDLHALLTRLSRLSLLLLVTLLYPSSCVDAGSDQLYTTETCGTASELSVIQPSSNSAITGGNICSSDGMERKEATLEISDKAQKSTSSISKGENQKRAHSACIEDMYAQVFASLDDDALHACKWPCGFARLCSFVEKEGSTPSGSLLFYSLIHYNSAFRHFVLSQSDASPIMLPLFRVLYTAAGNDTQENTHPTNSDGSANVTVNTAAEGAFPHLYLAMVTCLSLTEDDGFVDGLFKTLADSKAVESWYRQQSRVTVKATLGELAVASLSRALGRNVTRARDAALHANALATLANVISHPQRVHVGLMRNMVAFLSALEKRRDEVDYHIKMVEMGAVDYKTVDSERENGSVHRKHGQSEDLESLHTHLSALDEAIIQILRVLDSFTVAAVSSCAGAHRLANNVPGLDDRHSEGAGVVYVMLCQKAMFDRLFSSALTFADAACNISLVLSKASAGVGGVDESKASGMSAFFNDAEEVVEIVRKTIVSISPGAINERPAAKFKYVEDGSSQGFFVPYIWELVAPLAGVRVNSSRLMFG